MGSFWAKNAYKLKMKNPIKNITSKTDPILEQVVLTGCSLGTGTYLKMSVFSR